jgi:L-aminopeptidase/D-esterase-like protein
MEGVSIGHWTDPEARTGCTVISFDPRALTAVEVRGAAPGTRELDALAPGRLEQHTDAILLTGGSAFGLGAADGVAHELAARGRGYQTSGGPVPIVPAAVIFDLAIGNSLAPNPGNGREALRSATPISECEQGVVGAGTGATWSKFGGQVRRGGLGMAQVMVGEHLVTALIVLNAMGIVVGQGIADPRPGLLEPVGTPGARGEATTLMSLVTSFPCDHGALTRLCIAAHDALARMVVPAHTMFDGDVAFASTTSEGSISTIDTVRLCIATELAVEAAIVRAANPEQ